MKTFQAEVFISSFFKKQIMGTWCGLGKKPWKERSALSSPACDRMPVIPGPWGLFPEKMNRLKWVLWESHPGVSGSAWMEEAARASKGMEADLRMTRGQGPVWVELWPSLPTELGLLGRSCPGVEALWVRLGGQCYGRCWREALDSWLSKRGGCPWRVWERSTARSQRRGWGKDERLAVVWVKYRPRPVLEVFLSPN